ncbi:MAG: HAD family phosphatase [Euryarchaeota archaeon]|nr:HAD family phosphatase [Euryarchaeota archaeon]
MMVKIASFDLDGTLVEDTVFETVSRAAGFHEHVLKHDTDYFAGKITLEECFHLEYRYLVGLPLETVQAAMRDGKWIPGIREAVARLKTAGLKTIVLTDQPRFLAECALRFGFDEAVCSEATIKNGVVTSDIRPRFDKLANLDAWARERGVGLKEIVHVGNGMNDTAVFGRVAYGIAANPSSAAVSKAAAFTIDPMTDLRQATDVIIKNLAAGSRH